MSFPPCRTASTACSASPTATAGQDESLTTSSFAPAVDVYEDEHNVTLKIEVPGIDEKDIDVRLENNTLTVHGERKIEKEEKEENYRRVERQYGSFTRTFTLPTTVDSEKVSATYDKGVLKIALPKKAEAKPKQIKVNVGGAKRRTRRPSKPKAPAKPRKLAVWDRPRLSSSEARTVYNQREAADIAASHFVVASAIARSRSLPTCPTWPNYETTKLEFPMPIRWDKFTVKAQEAVQRANDLASEHGNPELLPVHLLAALLEDKEGIVPPVLEKIGIGPQAVLSDLYREIEKLPKVSGEAAQATLSNATNKLLEQAFKEASNFKDEYVSTEHLLLAITHLKQDAAQQILARHGATTTRF